MLAVLDGDLKAFGSIQNKHMPEKSGEPNLDERDKGL